MTATIPDDVKERARVNAKSQAFPGDYAAMTMREYIATALMPSMIDEGTPAEHAAAAAVRFADALLVELAK